MSACIPFVMGSRLSKPYWRDLAEALIGRPARLLARLVVAGLAYRLRRQSRRSLSSLDDRMLADIGLDRHEIDAVIRAERPVPAPLRYDELTGSVS